MPKANTFERHTSETKLNKPPSFYFSGSLFEKDKDKVKTEGPVVTAAAGAGAGAADDGGAAAV